MSSRRARSAVQAWFAALTRAPSPAGPQIVSINGEEMTHHKSSDVTQTLTKAGEEFEIYVKYSPKAFAEAKKLAGNRVPKVRNAAGGRQRFC